MNTSILNIKFEKIKISNDDGKVNNLVSIFFQ